MRLSQLIASAGLTGLDHLGEDTEISGLTADSRAVTLGALFAALPGVASHGIHHVSQAATQGAGAILHDGATQLECDLPQLIHPEPRLALAALAAAYFDHPARQLKMVAVTGSNGKTTVAAMVEAILTASGMTTGVIGTTGVRYPGITLPPGLTTPDPITLHHSLRAMADHGCQAVVAEVSSHALTQHRTATIQWDAAAFTNLTQDHLDYHITMEAYWQAKTHLFCDSPLPKAAILNWDDPKGLELTPQLTAMGIDVTGFSLKNCIKTDFFAHDIDLQWTHTHFHMHTPGQPLEIHLSASGRFNVANALTAAALCWSLGVREADIQAGLTAFRPVSGRMEPIQSGQPFTVIVDFAHTPDALEQLLTTAKEISTTGRRLLLFGCGGARDPGKRAIMGRIAGQQADMTILTDDNPRNEDPDKIRNAIQSGVTEAGGQCLQIPSRDAAIAHIVHLAKVGDVVLIAGKGHETVQITALGTHPFDDAQTAKDHLARMGFKDD